MRRRPPLVIGATYSEWTVVEQLSLDHAICKCSCGSEHRVSIKHLLAKRSERCRTCGNKRPSYKWRSDTSGRYPPKVKRAVTDAIRRCTNEDDVSYIYYGSRGIRVCSAWLDDPRLFADYLLSLDGWDDPNLVLDRIDNDGNYELGNLRWTTYLESNRNKRSSGPRVLTEEQVLEAKKLRKEDPRYWTYCKLGLRYDVCTATMCLAVTGVTWKHLLKQEIP